MAEPVCNETLLFTNVDGRAVKLNKERNSSKDWRGENIRFLTVRIFERDKMSKEKSMNIIL